VANYKILIKPTAIKELRKILNPDFDCITEKIRKLSLDPRPRSCAKLSNEEKYRIRQRNYRIIYFINDGDQEVIIYKIGHRRDVYKK
jgi:mRNA interferase RelE/StbE